MPVQYIIDIVALIVIIVLAVLLTRRKVLDYSEQKALVDSIGHLNDEKDYLNSQIEKDEARLTSILDKIDAKHAEYNELSWRQTNELNEYFNAYEDTLNNSLKIIKDERQATLDAELIIAQQECQKKINDVKTSNENLLIILEEQRNTAIDQAEAELKKLESLIASCKAYEKQKQDLLYATIQTPEEYRPDIKFLLTTVAEKVQHPDIISKLVWAEYVKPYLDETFKRIEIKELPGIYKLTNLENNKAYIGKSTNVKKRITDHFKSAIGISTIADQKVHHEILNTGFWNWTIEVIIYTDKDKLSELEKYYIDAFKTQDYGYNRNAGG